MFGLGNLRIEKVVMPQLSINTTETPVLDNVINKLHIYMEQNDQTLYGLASKMGFSYQPFYRIITKKHLPTIDSLVMIANHFNCTVSELIADKVFCDINLFAKANDIIKQQIKSNIRIYIPYTQFLPLVKKEFFCLEELPEKGILGMDTSDAYVFYKTEVIDIDGIFLVMHQNKIRLLNVVSISSKYIVVEENKQEIKIEQCEVQALAKFFNFLTINYDSVLAGVLK